MTIQRDIEETLLAATKRLLELRDEHQGWTGELSSSALSTATSVCALSLVCHHHSDNDLFENLRLQKLNERGLQWLIQYQNEDGGWGDTTDSPSNISTTTLCWAALNMDSPALENLANAEQRAEAWMLSRAKSLSPADLSQAIDAVYGSDRTFSAPILTMCALSGRFGKGSDAWKHIKALPFEIAACPHQWFRWLGLPVVSYALPALIAIGQARHYHRPSKNPIARCLRNLTKKKTLRVLQAIQPDAGGFLEAAPLTGFVLMSLASIEQGVTQVATKAVRFLVDSARDDGSWPIDTNLATWVSTLSVQALAGKGDLSNVLTDIDQKNISQWLLDQQYQTEHPYTHAAPGGWAWTNLSGGVPDADDTAGALLTLKSLSQSSSSIVDAKLIKAVEHGVLWLMDLQNKDGGIPTFCRGWGKLPFDQSSPDLTAHSLRAWHVWRSLMSRPCQLKIDHASHKAVRYLLAIQNDSGAWTPLWFGNQHAPQQLNPTYGTSRVLRAPLDMGLDEKTAQSWLAARLRGLNWLLSSQNDDGGWGGDVSTPSSIEETALAVEALACVIKESNDDGLRPAIERGCAWLIKRTESGTVFEPAPIGLYFANLWYTERLYPLIFTVSALGQAMRSLKYIDASNMAKAS